MRRLENLLYELEQGNVDAKSGWEYVANMSGYSRNPGLRVGGELVHQRYTTIACELM